jgi:polyisoprenoid-binding protein YceI
MARFLTAVVLAGLVGGAAFADEFLLTPDNTTVKFVGTKTKPMPGKHDGGFKGVKGSATYDGKDLTSLAITVDIDMNTIYTDTEKLTQHLKTPDFFDVKNNPASKFVSSKVEKGKEGYNVTGKLTMAGKTKELTFPATIEVKDGNLTLSSSFKLNRHDWGVSYGKGAVDDLVSLNISVKAKMK